MNIKIIDVKKTHSSCNFCNRGILDTEHGYRVEYPYEKVFEISSQKANGFVACMCGECAKELSNAINKHNI